VSVLSTCYGADIEALADAGDGFATVTSSTVTNFALRQWTDVAATLGFLHPLRVLARGLRTSHAGLTGLHSAAMAAFEDDLTAQGIEVVWITEPGWSHAGWLAQLNNWIRSRPGSIDCAPAIADAKYASPWDQVHPTDDGYNRYADCIAENLPPLG